MIKYSVEELARITCKSMGYDPDRRSINSPDKCLWELWVKPAVAISVKIYGQQEQTPIPADVITKKEA